MDDETVMGWMNGLLHPPWNCVSDVDAPAVLVPVPHALVPDVEYKLPSAVLLLMV